MVSGNGMTQVYFRGEDWSLRMPWEEIEAREVPEALLAIEGVDFVAGRAADGAVVVKTARGQGRICFRDGLALYSFEGEDVLGSGCFEGKTPEELLCLTFDSERPDAALQLEQLFRAERTGDLLVSARQGYDLRGRWEIPEHKSTHGALVASQMHVPLIISHPVKQGPMRTSDVFPTVLGLLGKDPPSGLDGVARGVPEGESSD
jgi:hypothetical protein